MKTTIEEINGKLCTVIRKPFDVECVKEQLDIKMPVVVETIEHEVCGKNIKGIHKLHKYIDKNWFCGINIGAEDSWFESIIVVLPALPRYPKPEDAPLLYRYMAEGIIPILDECESLDRMIFTNGFGEGRITHATHNGERVEVAIEGLK